MSFGWLSGDKRRSWNLCKMSKVFLRRKKRKIEGARASVWRVLMWNERHLEHFPHFPKKNAESNKILLKTLNSRLLQVVRKHEMDLRFLSSLCLEGKSSSSLVSRFPSFCFIWYPLRVLNFVVSLFLLFTSNNNKRQEDSDSWRIGELTVSVAAAISFWQWKKFSENGNENSQKKSNKQMKVDLNWLRRK